MFAGCRTFQGRTQLYCLSQETVHYWSEEEEQTFRPDKRVVQMLSQIKDHYRNPVIMAESSVSLDDALALFNMASALITLMAGQLREHKTSGKKGAKAAAAAGESSEDDEALYDFRLSQAG